MLPHQGDGEVEGAVEPQRTLDWAERPPNCTGPDGGQHLQGQILLREALHCGHLKPPTLAQGGWRRKKSVQRRHKRIS